MLKILFLFLLTLQLGGCSRLSNETIHQETQFSILSESDATTSATFKQSESNHIVSVSSEDAKTTIKDKDPKAIITSIVLDELDNDVFYTIELISNGNTYQIMIDAYSGDIKEWKLSQ